MDAMWSVGAGINDSNLIGLSLGTRIQRVRRAATRDCAELIRLP